MKPIAGYKLNGWTIARVFEWGKWYDCVMVKKGERGYIRINK